MSSYNKESEAENKKSLETDQTQEVEQCYLGCLLQLKERPDTFLTAANFFHERHKKVFETIYKLWDKNTIPDIQTVTIELNGAVEAAYIAELTNKFPSAVNINHFENKVYEASKTRKVAKITAEFTERMADASLSWEGKEAAIQNQINALAGALCYKHNDGVLTTYEEYRKRRADRKYWEEFTPALFNRLPFPDGTINLIGARSGAGKTNALINIMRELLNTAAPDSVTNDGHREQEKNAARRMVFVSREMCIDDIFDRLTLSLAWEIRNSDSCLE